MKRTFSVFMACIVIISALGVAWTKAQAAGSAAYEGSTWTQSKGIVFIFDAPGFAKKNVKVKPATLYIGSDPYPLSCIFKADEGKIRCDARGGLTQFAGQTGIIYMNGQIFYVIIPARGSPTPSPVPTDEDEEEDEEEEEEEEEGEGEGEDCPPGSGDSEPACPA